MSDEEGSEYEEEVEEEEQEAELVSEAPKKRIAADDTDGKIQEYEERRRAEREREEEDLRKLKEKQEKRKAEREEEERLLAERLKEAEERRRVEEEERKSKFDAEKKRREDEKKKREQMMASLTGKSLVIPPKQDNKNEKFGNIVQAKQEMGMTKEQKEIAKSSFLQTVSKQYGEADGLSDAEIKAKVKEMHSRIAKLEADKYDLEKRHERQEYDLRELNERQRQVARNKALKKGVDAADAGSSRHPPKVQVMSKYDRQTDRRNFNERRMMYESQKNAYPVFPGIPPPPAIFEKVIKKDFREDDEEAYNENEEETEDVEEEEE